MTDDTPTPRESGLWSQWRDHAHMLSQRLDRWALSRVKRLDVLDVAKAREATRMAAQARHLRDSFATWPASPPVDEERVRLIHQLADVQRKGEDLMAGLS